jgi:hypothetical protein
MRDPRQLWGPTHPLPPSAAVVADVYLWHRYQLAAVAKLVGGFQGTYATTEGI